MLQQPLAEPGGPVSLSIYIVVSDVDTNHAKAVAAGAEIVMAPEDQHYGGRLYSCRDPEGNLWNFGSYGPPGSFHATFRSRVGRISEA